MIPSQKRADPKRGLPHSRHGALHVVQARVQLLRTEGLSKEALALTGCESTMVLVGLIELCFPSLCT